MEPSAAHMAQRTAGRNGDARLDIDATTRFRARSAPSREAVGRTIAHHNDKVQGVSLSSRTSRAAAALVAAIALTATAGAASAAAQSPGDPTLEIAVGDDVAGGDHDAHVRAATSAGDDGQRHARLRLRAAGRGRRCEPHRRRGRRPAVGPATRPTSSRRATTRPTPRRTSRSPTRSSPASARSSSGSPAIPGIVQVDTEHYGPIGLADPSRPEQRRAGACSPTTSVDEAYYDCDATQYTVGYFAPAVHRRRTA